MTKEEKFKIQTEAYQNAVKWAEMMVKLGELKIGDDKIVNGQTVYGWVGTDEIASSIISYIDLEKLLGLGMKSVHKPKPKKLKRKEFKVENGTYKEITDKYQELKGIKLEGAEFGEVKRAIKTMLYSSRTQEDIINFMKFCHRICEEIKDGNEQAKNKFSWFENWTMLTIKRKLPEFLAGKFILDKKWNEI